MLTMIDELEAFHRFAVARIGQGGAKLSLSELVDLWELEQLTDSEQRDVHAALDRATDQLNRGAGRPAADLNSDLRQQYGFAKR